MIENVIEKLNKQFPYLYFSKNGFWCARDNGDGSKRDGTFIDSNKMISIHTEAFQIISSGEDTQSEFFHELQRLNRESEKAFKSPDKFFFCTRCSKTYPIEKYAAFHFAGMYCKECYNNDPELQDLIRNEDYN